MCVCLCEQEEESRDRDTDVIEMKQTTPLRKGKGEDLSTLDS